MTQTFKKLIIAFMFIFGIAIIVNFNVVYNSTSTENSMALIQSLRGGSNSNLSVPRNYDRNFHRILRKGFPDLQKRIAFENFQRPYYNSARVKISRIPNLTFKDKLKLLSDQDIDSINYFNSQGFYRLQQHYTMKPNIFDTRESFLLKMHNEDMRNQFLKSLN